jgi:voltage-gated potassium channel
MPPFDGDFDGRMYGKSDPRLREIGLAGLFLVGLNIVGAIGYHLLEDLSWIDGTYMTFITLTTIGFAEVVPLSSEGRILTMILATFGIGAVAFIATRTAQLLINAQVLRAKRMANRIGKLDRHFVLCGYGRIGRRIAQDLMRAGTPFVVVDNLEAKYDIALADGVLCVLGDAEKEEVLEAAGIKRARGLILTLPQDSLNVFVTLSARELNPALFIVARTDTHLNRRKLERAGATTVVAANEIGADRMASVILRPSVSRFVDEVLQSHTFDLNLDEVLIERGARVAGKTLQSSRVRVEFDAMVVAIVGEGGAMNFNPAADTVLNVGDTLIVMGTQAMISRLRTEACLPA